MVDAEMHFEVIELPCKSKGITLVSSAKRSNNQTFVFISFVGYVSIQFSAPLT